MSLLSYVSNGLNNVKNTFMAIGSNTVAAVTGKEKQYTFSSPIPGVASVAAHPFATAALVTPLAAAAGITKAPALASATTKVASSIAGVAKQIVVNNPVKSAVIATVGVPAVISAVKTNPQLPKQTVGLISDVGSTVGKVTGNLSAGQYKEAGKNVVSFVESHPIASAAAAVTAVAASTGIINNLLTAQNTRAVSQNTKATIEASSPLTPSLSVPSPIASTSPQFVAQPAAAALQPTAAVTTPVKPKAKKKKKKKKKAPAKKKKKKKAPKKKKKAKSLKKKKKKKK